MESQPQNPEFRNNPENIHPCHWMDCVVSLSKKLFPMLSTGKCPDMTEKLLTGM